MNVEGPKQIPMDGGTVQQPPAAEPPKAEMNKPQFQSRWVWVAAGGSVGLVIWLALFGDRTWLDPFSGGPPPEPPWWAGRWVRGEMEWLPWVELVLAPERGQGVTGQLIQDSGKPGFHYGASVEQAEEGPEVLLFSAEPRPVQGRPVPPRHYLLRRRENGRADLYWLPPVGAAPHLSGPGAMIPANPSDEWLLGRLKRVEDK